MQQATRATLAAWMLLATTGAAQARDDVLTFPIQAAIDSAEPDIRSKVDGSTVKFYFAGQKPPKAQRTMGTFTSNKKTNFANKSDQEGCNRAFLSALIALHDRALREGGNAVVDIHSYYKKQEFKSATDFQCGAGAILGGTALRGTVARF